MKIRLNLLPQKRKIKIRNKKIINLFVWQEGILIVAAIFLMGIIIGVTQVLDIQAKSLDNQIQSNSSRGNYAEIKKYEEALAETTNRIGNIDKIQKNNINWIPVFEKVNKNIPENVIIKSMLNDEYWIFISGIAKNREELVKMKSQFEADDCFADVAVPINDIVSRNDIDFSIDFRVNKNCLIRYE